MCGEGIVSRNRRGSGSIRLEAQDLILGAGATGLAASWASGLPVLEATNRPGGICSSYYVRAGQSERWAHLPADGEAYRFEIGGGHWIFGGDAAVLRLIEQLAPTRRYSRVSSVFLPDRGLNVPYPLQNHLRYLDPATASAALMEMSRPMGDVRTMADWLLQGFCTTLCELLFTPFHELYTAGLHTQIAPQDSYKSPVELPAAIAGALQSASAVGYTTHYIYPEGGLDTLAQNLASRSDIHYGARVMEVDTARRRVHCEDGSSYAYRRMISTLPLNRMLDLAGIRVETKPDPFTSVLVLNIGASRGERCPEDHWVYVPRSYAGFHRVGFYSNVDVDFLPASARAKRDRVSIYVERAHRGGEKPDDTEVATYSQAAVKELQQWGMIGDVEVMDPTWIDVAYTWSWPGSKWRVMAMEALRTADIHPVGRYARWVFQGIADSVLDGLFVGASFR